MFNFWRSQTASITAYPPMPIVVGAPRSGTTLLRFMLDANSELAIPPETGFLAIANQIKGRGEQLRERFFQAVINYGEPFQSWPDFEISAEEFRAALDQISPFNTTDGYRAFYRLYAARHGKPRWGDKTPLYCRHVKVIRKVLPEARFVHIIRDGRDVALSLRRMWFSPGSDMEVQASYWRDCILAARRGGTGRKDYLEVRYEELIRNTAETLQRICAHLDLTFEAKMLNYYQRAPERLKEHKGRSSPDGIVLTHEQRLKQQQRTTEPPDPACVFGWKLTMDSDERRRFQSVAGDLLEDLGYEI